MSRSQNELKDILQRVRQTRKITNALYLLSSARLRSDRAAWEYRAEYAQKTHKAMELMLTGKDSGKISSPFLERSRSGRPLYLIVTGDKGLCGVYNNDIVKFALNTVKEKAAETGAEPLVYGFGKVCRTKTELAGIFPEKIIPGAASHPDAKTSADVCEELIAAYVSGEASEVYFISAPYISAHGKPVCTRILPFNIEDFCANGINTEKTVFEPDASTAFDAVARTYLESNVYSLLVQSALSENAARMTAMKEATDKADEKAEELEKNMNAQRQLAITNELAEIAASAGAQKHEK